MVELRMKIVKKMNLQHGAKWFQEKKRKLGSLDEGSKLKCFELKHSGMQSPFIS